MIGGVPAGMNWVNEFWEEMKPSIGDGVYVNYLGNDESEQRVRNAYGSNYGRLQAVKAKYDPDNFFRMNQNIRATKAA
jgi:FAD/FMN-containing dehydrogenase